MYKQGKLVQHKSNIETSLGESTPTEAALIEVGVSRLHKRQLWQIFTINVLLLLTVPGSVTVAQAQDNCLPCHGDKESSVEHTVHGFLSCTSCHTNIHGFPHPERASLNKKESVDVCASCHKGLITDSYAKSFHGKAVHLGSERSATCVDCHGAHNILGQDNPDSKVAKQNLPQTCASCHNRPSPGFSEGQEHFTLTSSGAGAPMYYTANFCVWLTIIIIIALVIHIELQLYHNLRRILKRRRR